MVASRRICREIHLRPVLRGLPAMTYFTGRYEGRRGYRVLVLQWLVVTVALFKDATPLACGAVYLLCC